MSSNSTLEQFEQNFVTISLKQQHNLEIANPYPPPPPPPPPTTTTTTTVIIQQVPKMIIMNHNEIVLNVH